MFDAGLEITMATAGGKLLNELKDVFCECPICTEVYDEKKHVPRLLPCQHTFCSECLSKSIRGIKLVCSICKQSYKVNGKRTDFFPKDLTRRDLTEILGKLEKQSCTLCNRLENVRYHCTVCSIKLCKACSKVRRNSQCKTHSLNIVRCDDNETPDSSLDFLETKNKDICNLEGHENNTLMFYCKNELCRVSICSHCAIKDHRNHDWEELNAFYNKRKDLFLSRLSTAKNKVESAEKVKSLFNNDRDKVARNLGLTIEKIDQKKQEGIEFLNQESERICQTYKNTAAKLTEDFDMELRDLETYIENSNECCLISEQLLKENKAKFLSVEKTISDKLEIFGSKSFEHKKGDVNINLPLMEKNYENLATKVAELQRDLSANSTIMHQLSVIGVDERGIIIRIIY